MKNLTTYTPEQLTSGVYYHEDVISRVEVAYLEQGPDEARLVLMDALLSFWDAALEAAASEAEAA